VIVKSKDSNTRDVSTGVLKSSVSKPIGDSRIFINSVGEGAIWVSDQNGPLNNGDYITKFRYPWLCNETR
jgi:hypothetical protein